MTIGALCFIHVTASPVATPERSAGNCSPAVIASEAISSAEAAWIASSQGFLAMTDRQTGSAIEYFTWLSAKLDSIEAMPSSRVSLVFRKVS